MQLNNIKPTQGAKTAKTRVGRGIGSGLGKTCGRGHKGQHSRSGGYHKVGFEGGQLPLQRRVPKFGFKSRKALVTVEVRLHELNKVASDQINLTTLRQAQVINGQAERVKVILAGNIDRAVNLQGLKVTKGARAAITAAGGQVEE